MSIKDKVQYHRVADSADLTLSEGIYTDYRFEPHYHIDFHIGLVVSGVQQQKFNGQQVLLGPGRVSIMPPGEIHDGSAYQDPYYRLNTFRITQDMLDEHFLDIFDRHRSVSFAGAMLDDAILSKQLRHLFSLIKGTGELSSLPVEENWLKVLHPILSQLNQSKAPEVKGGLSGKHWDWINEYCREHMADKITLAQLGSISGLSRYQLLRRFEKTIGITPHAWLTQLRLEYACRMLRKSDEHIANIATNVGFYDQSHFNRAFKNAYGVAPSKY